MNRRNPHNINARKQQKMPDVKIELDIKDGVVAVTSKPTDIRLEDALAIFASVSASMIARASDGDIKKARRNMSDQCSIISSAVAQQMSDLYLPETPPEEVWKQLLFWDEEEEEEEEGGEIIPFARK